jgi:hypothetical protein
VLAVYNTSGFVASLVLPSYADRTEDYLRPRLVCGLPTLTLVALLAVTTSLPAAVIGLVVLGGPAGGYPTTAPLANSRIAETPARGIRLLCATEPCPSARYGGRCGVRSPRRTGALCRAR